MTDKAYELFNLILSGEGDWDYSTLEELLDITHQEGYEEGYKKAKAEQPVIKPLEFKRGLARTDIGPYMYISNSDPKGFYWWFQKGMERFCRTEEEVIKACNEHYQNMIKSCLEQNDPKS